MEQRTPEIVLDAIDGIYMWRAAKPGRTVFGSYVGRIMVTNHRFMFLSTGVSGVARALAVGVVGGPIAALTLGQTRTDDLDLSALREETSVSGSLHFITEARVHRRLVSTYLSIETSGTRSLPPIASFMARIGLNRAAIERFHAALESARALQSR